MADRHIRRTGADYAEALKALLPTGFAWPRDSESTLMKAIEGLAEIWGYVDRRASDLLEQETDPRITVEMLTDWERNWGLPDDCFFGAHQTINERQKLLVMKMTLLGAQSRAFFIWVCAQLGHTVTITEFSPFMVGVSSCGDTRPKDTAVNLLTGFGVGE